MAILALAGKRYASVSIIVDNIMDNPLFYHHFFDRSSIG